MRVPKFWKTVLFLVGAATYAVLELSSTPLQAAPLETKARNAFMIEDSTGTVLFAKSEDERVPPASLLKLMTSEYVFHELSLGHISEDTTYKVSENAWRTGGALSRTSTMFAALNSSIRVIDLLRGVVVQSANDGCIILAEGLAGSEDAFADLLTKRGKEIGLTASVFANSNGLPNPKNKVTMRDLVTLARHIRTAYPKYFEIYSEKEFMWNKIKQSNRNPLLYMNIGADGMKTGFTDDSGYAIVGTAVQNGVRLFVAMSGLKTDKERGEEARKMLEWGFANFQNHQVFGKDAVIAEASVFGGDRESVPLKAAGPVDIYIPVDNAERIRARIAYKWPLKPPIASGNQIGILTISVGERPVRTVPVFATENVGTGTLTSKAFDGLKELLFFWL
jgi:D-alanyl-D-alanine carboxypeptidase (penicillin-binding protein 5/6)